MSMSNEEFEANKKVQSLKCDVDEADNLISQGSLSIVNSLRLQQLIASVNSSVKSRGFLKSMGADQGHVIRVSYESGILRDLRDELAKREAAEASQKSLQQAARLKDIKLPANATWAKK
ncbi:hypothetical protein VC273_19220 [Xanthomonas nasturtii]|uniref:hypothetical protein n=1 Tax=Xanthomonas TaxID=338 RepID=UPI00128FD8D8|nr:MULTISPECIES: hypothetical protein [Xanthomonas]MEA9557944.1 hypothetical protein [Xanthomonas nasturtii]